MNNMIVLYIDSEHCTSLEQLKEYFTEDLTFESDIYSELLDYGRHGDIARWLLQEGESELSSLVESISNDLSDSAFFAQLKSIITGAGHDSGHMKPAFEKCFSFEGLQCDVKGTEAKVRVILKVLLSANEIYELSVSCNWGMRAQILNPYSHSEGKTISFDFIFHKHLYDFKYRRGIGDITVMAEGVVLLRNASAPSVANANYKETAYGINMSMIYVQGGEFMMGGTLEQGSDAAHDETIIRRVTVKDFYIGQFEVTQAQWEAIMGTSIYQQKNVAGGSYTYGVGPVYPMYYVSWEEASEFCRILSRKTGKKYSLPTEAEWEYAARGGRKRERTKYSGSNLVDYVAWYTGNSSNSTHPVGSKNANELDIYDMSGNVWEWCYDWYGSSYSRGDTENPAGPGSGSSRVLRGGSWNRHASRCRVSSRDGFSPGSRLSNIGFRVVCRP